MWLTEAADRSNDQRADSSVTFAGDASRIKLLSLVFITIYSPPYIKVVHKDDIIITRTVSLAHVANLSPAMSSRSSRYQVFVGTFVKCVV